MPAPVISAKRVQFVGNYELDSGKDRGIVDPGGHEHRLQALWSGEEDVGWVSEHRRFLCLADVTVPESASAADQFGIPAEPNLKVIQQGADWANVKHAWRRQI